MSWISLNERPPPATVMKPRLLLRFRDERGGFAMGYYLGAGKVRILGHHAGRQIPLLLEEFTHWQALNFEQLLEAERHAELGKNAASQRHECRGDEKASGRRDREPPPLGTASAIGFEDLEDSAEWADLEQETAPRADKFGGTGDLLAGQ